MRIFFILHGFAPGIYPQNGHETVLMRVVHHLSCLKKTFSLVFTSKIDGIADTEDVKLVVVAEIDDLMKIVQFLAEWIGLGDFDQVCF
ncbi:MAG: hypothetical protein A4E58_03272 [Syntrophorhabdus sp. PtaB.Bin006]|nr:MAG: hypothetical protein A4E58_03272 [Syntrophorhabdus sp. PtaB.Bin006]